MANWSEQIDLHEIFHNDDMSVRQKASMIGSKFRNSIGCDNDLLDLLIDLEDTDTPDSFDDVWSEIYDWADENRVWIRTI